MISRGKFLLAASSSLFAGCSGGGVVAAASDPTRGGIGIVNSTATTTCSRSANRQRAIAFALLRPDTAAFSAAKIGTLYGTMWGAGAGSGGGPETSRYLDLVERECSLSYGWGIKGLVYQDHIDFTFGDNQIAVANFKNMVSGGGYLVTATAPPSWITSGTSRAEALIELKRDISAPMRRYVGNLDHWIVVNEGINVGDGNVEGLANSAWLSSIGSDYIYQSFLAARKADPSATLIYNDNGVEEESPYSAAKRNATLNLLTSLKASGVIDGLGIQGHLGLSNRYDSNLFKQFLDAVYALGLGIFVTELDVNDRNGPADIATRDALVANRYSEFLKTVVSHPGTQSINSWGLSDDHSWLQGFSPRADGIALRPCLFDSNLNRKSSYLASIGVLQAQVPTSCRA